MNKQDIIIWDTTQFPCDYPENIKKIYFKCSISNRKSFSSWIGTANSIFFKDLDWWSTAAASRNPYVSNLFHQICIIETIKKISKFSGNFKIVVKSPQLKIILEKILIKKNFQIFINKKEGYLKKYINIIKSIFFSIFIFISVRIFTKKRKLDLIKKKKTLIDTFIFNDIKKGERLYKEINEIVKMKKYEHVFFVPTIVPQKNLLKVFSNIIFLSKKKYIFKEHYLSFYDLIFAFLHFARVRKFLVKYKNYKNIDLSKLIIDEIYLFADYYSIIISLLNLRFAKALRQEKIEIKKTINWFENQTIDKGWNLGFRKYHQRTLTTGYQGFLYYGQYLNQSPSKEEEKARVIPQKIFVNSKLFVQPRKEFFKKMNIQVGPALSYNLNYLNKKFKKKQNIEVLLILNGIYNLDKKLIKWVAKSLKNINSLNITIKPHPILPITKIDKKFLKKFKNRINLTNERLDNLLKKTKISICSGPTSGSLESIAYRCYLICPVFEIYDKINLDIFKIPSKNFKLTYNVDEFSNTIKALINKKKLFLKTKKITLERATNTNIKKLIN